MILNLSTLKMFYNFPYHFLTKTIDKLKYFFVKDFGYNNIWNICCCFARIYIIHLCLCVHKVPLPNDILLNLFAMFAIRRLRKFWIPRSNHIYVWSILYKKARAKTNFHMRESFSARKFKNILLNDLWIPARAFILHTTSNEFNI